jgi:hypothetical protein
MEQKRSFKRAFDRLKKFQGPTVQKVIMERCEWSPQLFSMKKDGKRGLSQDESDIIETTFRSFGIDAWSGQELVTV